MSTLVNRESFFFVQMTDIQFGMYSANADFAREAELYRQAIEHINRLSPRFVIFTGDLINEPGDEPQTAAALRLQSRLRSDIPLYLAPGNHDIANVPTGANLRWYRQRLGNDWYAFEEGSWRFLVINSCLIQHPEQARSDEQTQRSWLVEQLSGRERAQNERTVLCMHHPWFLKEADEPDDYFNIPQAIRRSYLELLKRHGLHWVFCGHLHRNRLAQSNGLAVVTTGPLGLPLGDDPSGLRIVRIDGQSLEHKYYGLDHLPSVIAADQPLP